MSLAVCILLPTASLAGKEEADENPPKGRAQIRKPTPKIVKKKTTKTNREKIEKQITLLRKQFREDTLKLRREAQELLFKYEKLEMIEKQVRKLDKKKKVHSQ